MGLFWLAVVGIVVVSLGAVAALSFTGWMALREVGLGPWASSGGVIVGWVVLGAVGRLWTGGNKDGDAR